MRICLMLMLAAAGWLALGWYSPVSAADEAAEVESATELDAAGHGDEPHGDEPHGEEPHGDTAHGDTAHANESPVSWDPDLAIVTAVIFLVLLAVLWKFAWGPIASAVDSREQRLADDLAQAARNNDESRRLLSEHEAKLGAAAGEVRQMLDEARKDADLLKQRILEEAQAAAHSEKDRALREIETAKNAALQDVAEKSVETAVDLAGRIVQRQLSPQDHHQLIRESLEKFPSKN